MPPRNGRIAGLKARKKNRLVGLPGESRAAIALLLPSLLGLCVFFLVPFVDTVRRSLYDARGQQFVGAGGYASVVENEAFQLAAANTAKFICVCIPILLLVSLGLGLLVRAVRTSGSAQNNAKDRAKLFKTSYLLPMAIPVASMVLLWQVLFHKSGLINAVFTSFGAAPVDFMGTSAAFWVLVLTYVWKNAGYNMVLWLAGLDGIPPSLYEAARVDGAGAWQCFRFITLPSLLPTLGLTAILSLLNSFKVFREAYLVAGPYPHESIYLLQHLFNNWFQNLDISRLCAAAVMLCAVLVGVILLMQRFLDNNNE